MMKMKKYLEQFTSNRILLSCVKLQLLSIGSISYYNKLLLCINFTMNCYIIVMGELL